MAPDSKSNPDFSDVRGGASSTAPRAPTAAQSYTVVKGDSLSKIAKHFYGDASKWRKLYEVNKQVVGSNPDLIKPGQVLTIPSDV